MSELSDSDRAHLEGWNDTGVGYDFHIKVQVQCLWCDYTALGNNTTEAIRKYIHEHEDVIRVKADEARRDYLGS